MWVSLTAWRTHPPLIQMTNFKHTIKFCGYHSLPDSLIPSERNDRFQTHNKCCWYHSLADTQTASITRLTTDYLRVYIPSPVKAILHQTENGSQQRPCTGVIILQWHGNDSGYIVFFLCDSTVSWRKEMFYLTTHSTHIIYGYMASNRTSQIARENNRYHHYMDYSFRLAARFFICTIKHTV